MADDRERTYTKAPIGDLSSFDSESFSSGGITHRVFRKGT